MSKEEVTFDSPEEAYAYLQDKEPGLHQAIEELGSAMKDLEETSQRVTSAQKKGLEVPGASEMVTRSQMELTKALDAAQLEMRQAKDEMAVRVAGQVYSTGMEYVQGIVFAVHYARMSQRYGDRLFERLVTEAYALAERQSKRLAH